MSGHVKTSHLAGWVALNKCVQYVRDSSGTQISASFDYSGVFLFHVSAVRSCWNVMMTSSNWNIFRVIGPLCREFTGHRWIPLTKASDAELWCFLWSLPEQTVHKHSLRRWFETPCVSLWRHCNGGTENGSHASNMTSKLMSINSCPATPNMSQIWVTPSENGLQFGGTKPLPEPILTYHLWNPRQSSLSTFDFHKKCISFHTCDGLMTRKHFHIILVDGKPPVTGWFPTQRASNAESAPKAWCHHAIYRYHTSTVLSFSSWKADANSEQKYARSRFWSHRQTAATPAKPLQLIYT